MKKQFLLSTLILFVNIALIAQVNTTIIQQKTYGGNYYDFLFDAIQTNDGGYLIGGSSHSDISGVKTDTSRGFSDAWILKLDNNLNIEWQKTVGGSGFDCLIGVIQTNDNGFLMLCSSNSPISGEKTDSSYGGMDYWVIKTDFNGNILWQKTYGGNLAENPWSIIKIDNNRFLLTGVSDSDSSGVKTEDSRGNCDFWIVLIDSLGSIIYDKTYGGLGWDIAYNASFDSINNKLYLIGTSNSGVSGDISNSSYGSYDCLLFQINIDDGSIISDYRYGGNQYENAGHLLSLNNKMYLCALSESNISGVKSENSRGGDDYWILKLDENGSIIWDKTIGGNNNDGPSFSYFIDDNQLLYIGRSQSDISGEKTEACIGQGDYWLVSIDTNANVLWQKTIGGFSEDNVNKCIVLGTNHYILFGSSQSDISGHKTENSYGLDDYWVVEIAVNLSLADFSDKRLAIYPNPTQDFVKIDLANTDTRGLLYVFDVNGKIVLSKEINSANAKIDLTHLVSGVYFISFYDEEGNVFSNKLVKN